VIASFFGVRHGSEHAQRVAIFGIKGKLNDIRDGIALTNALLEEIAHRGKNDPTDSKSS